MDVTIVIASHGEQTWLNLGTQRAARCAFQLGVPVIYVHGLTLHGARNAGLAQVETEHVVFLDADDELAPGYIDAMATGSADIRAPAVSYITPNGRARAPYVPRVAGHTHACTGECLAQGNFIVIGACVRTRVLSDVGGFEAWPMYEDWAIFARCWVAGATVETIPEAVYRAHVRPDSRNRAPDRQARDAAHWAIHQAIWPAKAAA